MLSERIQMINKCLELLFQKLVENNHDLEKVRDKLLNASTTQERLQAMAEDYKVSQQTDQLLELDEGLHSLNDKLQSNTLLTTEDICNV